MKINHILIIGLLTTTAAYAKYTVDVYNYTPYNGTRKVIALDIAKDSKTRALKPCKTITTTASTASTAPGRSARPQRKECTPGHSKFETKMEGDLLDKVIVKLKTTPGSDEVTQVATYNIPAGLAGKNWKFIVFQDPETQTFQICGFSKGTKAQEVATMGSLAATGAGIVGTTGTGIGGATAVSSALGIPIGVLGYENFKKGLGISQEWQDRECIGFVSVNAKKIKSTLK